MNAQIFCDLSLWEPKPMELFLFISHLYNLLIFFLRRGPFPGFLVSRLLEKKTEMFALGCCDLIFSSHIFNTAYYWHYWRSKWNSNTTNPAWWNFRRIIIHHLWTTNTIFWWERCAIKHVCVLYVALPFCLYVCLFVYAALIKYAFVAEKQNNKYPSSSLIT